MGVIRAGGFYIVGDVAVDANGAPVKQEAPPTAATNAAESPEPGTPTEAETPPAAGAPVKQEAAAVKPSPTAPKGRASR